MFTSEFWKKLKKWVGYSWKCFWAVNRKLAVRQRSWTEWWKITFDLNVHAIRKTGERTAAEFLYNIVMTEDLGISPYELDFAWVPKSQLDFIARTEVADPSVEKFKERLKGSLEDAQFACKVSKAK